MRFAPALAALGLIALATGCAVGRFIAGAPSTQERHATNELIARRCSGCHEVPDPAAMTAEGWEQSLVRMRRRMTLPEAEWDSLAAMRR